jgi:hypothetical protein
LNLLFVVIAAFFVLAVPVLLVTYLFIAVVLCRAVVGFCRRLILDACEIVKYAGWRKPSRLGKQQEPEGSGSRLWDSWVDGPI